jgi:hypothetical protein
MIWTASHQTNSPPLTYHAGDPIHYSLHYAEPKYQLTVLFLWSTEDAQATGGDRSLTWKSRAYRIFKIPG